MKPFTYVVLTIIFILVIIITIFITINHLFNKYYSKRFDGDVNFKFLSIRDYPNLKMDKVSTISSYNVKLNGGIFYYPNRKYKGVIIFFHGLYTGYLNYLNLIEYFASKDYKVISFDMYGYMSSEGSSIKGLGTGDKDNKVILNFVKNHHELKNYPIYIIGHSWGAHCALTTLIHDDLKIKKVVAFNPYNSNVDCNFSIVPSSFLIAPFIYLYNLVKFGYESTYSVTSALKYSSADVLILCGGNDQIVKDKYSYVKFKKSVVDNNLDNVEIKYYKDRNHFIYLDNQAANYYTNVISFPKNKEINYSNLDYQLINKLNEEVLSDVIKFLER